MKYDNLSRELIQRMEYDKMTGRVPCVAFDERGALRRNPDKDRPNAFRGAFVRDVDKILHSAYYSRFADKTQVFSFYKNDDISRRALHVQLVSRIARTIGRILKLNEEGANLNCQSKITLKKLEQYLRILKIQLKTKVSRM